MGNISSHSSGNPLKNDMELCWEKVEGLGCKRGREGHSSCSAGNKMYIFGGVCYDGDGQLEESSELWAFDPVAKRCERVEASGQIPVGRYGAAMASVDDALYLFGGLSNCQGWMNDLHRFDICSNSWEKLNPGGCVPSARDKMTCAAIEKKLYMFGGFGPYNEKQAWNAMEDKEDDKEDEEEEDEENENVKFGWFDDMFIYDVVLNKWTQPMVLNKGPSKRAAASMVATSSGNTALRSTKDGHNSSSHGDNNEAPNTPNQISSCGAGEVSSNDGVLSGGRKLVVFGGRDKKGRLNDVHVFDADAKKWIHDLKIDGKFPDSRSFHSSIVIGNRMVICGGRAHDNGHFSDSHVLDLETMQWMQPEMKKSYDGRGLMAVGVVGGWVVMYGGSSNFDSATQQCTKLHDDFYILKAGDVGKGKVIVEEELTEER